MSKYIIGDKVKLIEDESRDFCGKLGTIISVLPCRKRLRSVLQTYKIKLDSGETINSVAEMNIKDRI